MPGAERSASSEASQLSDEEEYAAGVARGELRLRRCLSCDQVHFYPRPHCPLCFSADLDWVTALGTGSIYSFSVMRRAKPPYAIAFVTLDEGVSLMTNLVDCDFAALAIGQRVAAVFREAPDGRTVPMFAPISA